MSISDEETKQLFDSIIIKEKENIFTDINDLESLVLHSHRCLKLFKSHDNLLQIYSNNKKGESLSLLNCKRGPHMLSLPCTKTKY